MGDVDELYGLKNQFYLGSYQQVINDAMNPAITPRTDQGRLERKVYLYRAQIAQGRYSPSLNEIKPSDAPELKAVQILARYLSASDPQGKQVSVSAAQELLSDSKPATPLLAVIIATVFYYEGLLEDALRTLAPFSKNLECVALTVQAYLKMNRADLAKKEVTAMKSWADDATLAQAVEAWQNVFSNADEKYQEAFYTFDELSASNNSTSRLLNGKAVCRILAGNFEEAEQFLLEALNRNSNDPETLSNLIVCANATGKPADVIARYFDQLKESSPQHPFVEEYALKEAMFDRAAQRFAV
ncbi:hypothetical protein HDV05_000411 [Chytridiales sp. JEL 0842]|nr:hypothetical protein HDV05_000411 [Chytridiales sp. JEL 0842]